MSGYNASNVYKTLDNMDLDTERKSSVKASLLFDDAISPNKEGSSSKTKSQNNSSTTKSSKEYKETPKKTPHTMNAMKR